MEQFLLNIFKDYGLTGVLIAYVFYRDVILPKDKKKRGDWVSFKDIEQIRKRVEFNEARFNSHLDKETLEDVRMEKLEMAQRHQTDEINHLFNQTKSQWERMDDMGKDIKKILFMLGEMKSNNA